VQKAPYVPRQTGNGCAGKLLVDAQGYAGGEPVVGRIELAEQRVSISTLTLADGKRAQYKGTLTTSLCEHASPEVLYDVPGTLTATGARKTKLGITLNRADYFSPDRERLHFEASAVDDGDFELELWDTPADRLQLRDAYQKAVKSADDLEAVLESPRGALLIGALEPGSRSVRLYELSKQPLAVRRRSDAGSSCEGHTCDLTLAAFEVSPVLNVVVVVRNGQYCSAKCSFEHSGEIWTLGPEGFVSGATLPSTSEMPGGLNYGSRSSRTSLYWVDADGVPPLEILVEHDDEDGKSSTSIVGFDPEEHTYSYVEELPKPKGGYLGIQYVRLTSF
jgi:hypothetical protein